MAEMVSAQKIHNRMRTKINCGLLPNFLLFAGYHGGFFFYALSTLGQGDQHELLRNSYPSLGLPYLHERLPGSQRPRFDQLASEQVRKNFPVRSCSHRLYSDYRFWPLPPG